MNLDTGFSFSKLQKALSEMPEPLGFAAYVTSPRYYGELREEIRSVESRPDHSGVIFLFGIRLIVKPGQVAPVWFFTDERFMEAYLDGRLKEENLKRMSHPEICRPGITETA